MPPVRPPSPHDPFAVGSLTDVAGLLVGHHQRCGRGWQTGTTVVFAPGGAVAAVEVRGGGPGTRETEALAVGNLVERVHAVCLTGGSAYGLAAADGVMEVLEARRLGVGVGAPSSAEHGVVPVVPTAVVFDLGRGGDFARRPDAAFGRRAIAGARATPDRGAIGAGTGCRAGGLQGGIGMAATSVSTSSEDQPSRSWTVAALAVVNASGSTIDDSTALPWMASPRLARPIAAERRQLALAIAHRPASKLNTTIGVVATDAALARHEALRLARGAHDGLARAVRPAHLSVDGDTVFALATGFGDGDSGDTAGSPSRHHLIDLLSAAAADVFATACTDAVLTATSRGTAPSYRDLCPSAYRLVATPDPNT